ncbi:MAG TPA: hypothetical protein VJH03_00635 [Blastocatellia bacterium]|nr:hypothetical protein [Blastocatellia bacterium]
MTLTLASLLLAAIAAYSPQAAPAGGPSIDQEFSLRIGRTVTITGEKLKITFASVAEDSRCPKGVDCIWAGNGRIVLEVRKKSKKPARLSLNTLQAPTEGNYRQYRIRLVRLDPHPVYGVTPDPAGYEATLVVSKQ